MKPRAMLGCSLTLALLAQGASASTTWTESTVTYAGSYGNGNVFVALAATIDEPGCPFARFDVPAGDLAKTVLATAYAALATGKTVRVFTSGCLGQYPTLDNSVNSYFLIMGP